MLPGFEPESLFKNMIKIPSDNHYTVAPMDAEEKKDAKKATTRGASEKSQNNTENREKKTKSEST